MARILQIVLILIIVIFAGVLSYHSYMLMKTECPVVSNNVRIPDAKVKTETVFVPGECPDWPGCPDCPAGEDKVMIECLCEPCQYDYQLKYEQLLKDLQSLFYTACIEQHKYCELLTN